MGNDLTLFSGSRSRKFESCRPYQLEEGPKKHMVLLSEIQGCARL